MKVTWSIVLLLSTAALFCLYPATEAMPYRYDDAANAMQRFNDLQKTAELMKFLERFRQAFLQLEMETQVAAPQPLPSYVSHSNDRDEEDQGDNNPFENMAIFARG